MKIVFYKYTRTNVTNARRKSSSFITGPYLSKIGRFNSPITIIKINLIYSHIFYKSFTVFNV